MIEKKHAQYQIISGNALNVSARVQEYLDVGWELYGYPTVVPGVYDGTPFETVFQAVVAPYRTTIHPHELEEDDEA